MANENRCVFCGQTVSAFRSTSVTCGGIYQTACKSCAKEMESLNDIDRCRRALLRGLADRPERLQEHLEVNANAEEHRPKCIACGGKLRFMQEQHFDNTPYGDGIFHGSFDVLPAWCISCGRFEFFHPSILKQNKFMAFLHKKDLLEDAENT